MNAMEGLWCSVVDVGNCALTLQSILCTKTLIQLWQGIINLSFHYPLPGNCSETRAQKNSILNQIVYWIVIKLLIKVHFPEDP